jgi:thiol-disulfide isomerase/thioredoxin
VDGLLCVEHYKLSPDFEIFLPPGEYSLTATGANNGTLTAKRSLSVPEGVAEMKLHPMQLSLNESRSLIGRPAPDLTDVIAWKGGGPKSLQELKGNVVLLDFWGYWCHSCIKKIPRLIELDHRYRDRGLRILGVHIDSDDRITSLAEYDRFAALLKNGILKGNRIPYPVALIAEKPTTFRGTSEKEARCETAANYGVNSYPTMILIDRDGRVAGEFHDTPEGLAMLESLLNTSEGNDNSDR